MNVISNTLPNTFLRSLAYLVATLAAISGIVCLKRAREFPVYTDMLAPSRLSMELRDHPRDKKFPEWEKRLSTYETPHKRLYDLGCGLLGLGAGTLLSLGICGCYSKVSAIRRARFVIVTWICLWVLPALFSPWYYSVRQKRFDYPTWGDSTSIGTFLSWFAVGLGCVIFGAIAKTLMIGHQLSPNLRPCRPRGFWGWLRGLLLALWIVMLLKSVIPSVEDGNVGRILFAVGSLPLMFAMLSAEPRREKADGSASITEPISGNPGHTEAE